MTGDGISKLYIILNIVISDTINLFVDFQIIENFCHYNFFFNDVEESLQLCSNGCLLSKV